jgi:hypothetical protein
VQLNASIRYPAPPDQVFAMLTDEAFLRQVCEATGALSSEVTVEPAGGGAKVTTRRVLPTDQIPDFVKKFVGQTLTVLRIDSWQPPAADGSRSGTLSVEIAGAPVRLGGTLSLRPDADGAVEDVNGDLKASVPLFGSAVEQAAEPAIRAGLRKEEQLGQAWLSR